MTKRCCRCGEIKTLAEFHRNAASKDDHGTTCKLCDNARRALHYRNEKANNMKQVRFDALYKSLSSQARKVYDATPAMNSWNHIEITNEMRRNNVPVGDMRIIMGCINSLISSGLVTEPQSGFFQRVLIRQKQINDVEPEIETYVAPTKEPEMIKEAIAIKAEPATPIGRLGSFAVRLRELAADMEDAAIELAGQAEKNETETAKMRQLQAILKSLG